jgi:fructokinase
MKSKKVVTGIGELLWDLLPQGKQLGGAPCNFSFHASQAGCEAYVVSAVGNDDQGKELIEAVNSMGLSNQYIQTNSYTTGYVSVKLNEWGHPDYTIHENVAWDFIEWNEMLTGLAGRTDAVCFGSLAQRNALSGSSLLRFLDALPDHCLKVFDINLRQKFYTDEIIRRSLEFADILKLNDDELPVVASLYSLGGKPENQLKKLREETGLKIIALTMGEKGSILLDKDECSFVESKKVKIVDTVGAGDSFTAILIAGILNEIPLKEVHKKATEVAAFVCTCQGATPFIDKDLLQY